MSYLVYRSKGAGAWGLDWSLDWQHAYTCDFVYNGGYNRMGKNGPYEWHRPQKLHDNSEKIAEQAYDAERFYEEPDKGPFEQDQQHAAGQEN